MQQQAGQERVTLSSSAQSTKATTVRAIIVAIAAGAGALATAAIGPEGPQPQQYWAALAAAAAAVGGVLGINPQSTQAYAPRGELDRMRTEQLDTVSRLRRDKANGQDQKSDSSGVSSDQQRHE